MSSSSPPLAGPPTNPQSAGDIIGRAVRVFRQNIPLIFKVLAPSSIFLMAGSFAIQYTISYGVADVAKSNNLQYGIVLAVIFLTGMVVATIAGWIVTLRQLALVRLFLGFSPDWKSADAFLWQKKWVLIGLYLFTSMIAGSIFGLWFIQLGFVGMFAALLKDNPMALGWMMALGGLIWFLGVVLTFSLSFMVVMIGFSAMACEDVGFFTIMSRAFRLTFGSFWRSLGFGILLSAVMLALYSPLALPVVALSMFDYFRQGVSNSDAYQVPLYLLAIDQVWESLTGLLLRPIMFLSFGYYYFDTRLRREGLDISRRLQKMAEQAV